MSFVSPRQRDVRVADSGAVPGNRYFFIRSEVKTVENTESPQQN
jgi:hypothetical protein